MDEEIKENTPVLQPKLEQTVRRIWEKIVEIWNSPKRYQLLLIIGMVGIGMIFCSEMGKKPDQKNEKEAETSIVSLPESNQAYIQMTEERLERIIGQIDGVGECSVMLTLKEGSKNVYASEEKRSQEQSSDYTKTEQTRTQSQSSNEQKLIVVEDDKGISYPVIEKTIEPQINGVVVVCRGAKSSQVCQQVTEAVTTVLGIRSTQVCVSPMDR